MPRYYFHLHDALGLFRDRDGRELPDLEAAKARSLEYAREMIADSTKHGTLGLNRAFEVKDGKGETVFTLQFHEAVETDTAPKP